MNYLFPLPCPLLPPLLNFLSLSGNNQNDGACTKTNFPLTLKSMRPPTATVLLTLIVTFVRWFEDTTFGVSPYNGQSLLLELHGRINIFSFFLPLGRHPIAHNGRTVTQPA